MSPSALASPAALFRAAYKTRVPGMDAACAYEPGLGLVVLVTTLPAPAFTSDFLLGGPAVHRALFTYWGEQLWAEMHALAQQLVADHGEPGDLAAVMLAPSAIAAVRAQLKQQRAA